MKYTPPCDIRKPIRAPEVCRLVIGTLDDNPREAERAMAFHQACRFGSHGLRDRLVVVQRVFEC